MVARDPAAEDAYRISLSAGAADGLRTLSHEWVDALGGRAVVPYEATADLSDGEVFLIEDEATLADLQPLYGVASEATDLPTIPADELDQRIALYAVVAGEVDRIALLKRSDPRIGYRGKRTFLATLDDRLELLEGPTFAFYTSFDLVLAPDWALVVNQTEFERLFRDAGLVEQHINEWVAGIEQYLPWAPGSLDALAEVASRDSRIWRRLREINRRGHLVDVTIDQVRNYATEMDLQIDHLIENDQLIFDPDERFSTLHLLNEDLFKGPLSEERFEAQRKTSA
jgi:hypothetical protein